MPKLSHALLLAAMGVLPVLAQAATPTITDEEEHVLRGFFDRQSAAISLNKLALEKGSRDAIKKFAQSELDMYTKLADGVAKLDDEFKLITQPMSAGGGSPKLGQGVTRGVESLPAGSSWSSAQVGGLLNGTMSMGGAPGGAAPGGAPGAAPGGGGPGGPGAGGAPGGAPASGPPGAGGNRPAGGGGMSRYEYDLADMQKLSGADFDKQYAFRVAIAHNAMLRHIGTELTSKEAQPDMVAFAKAAFTSIAAQNSNLERLLLGQDLSSGPPGARPAGGGGAPGTQGAGGPGGPGGPPPGN